jgi:hypothetical protein
MAGCRFTALLASGREGGNPGAERNSENDRNKSDLFQSPSHERASSDLLGRWTQGDAADEHCEFSRSKRVDSREQSSP